jgi:hypothetical protein
MRSKAAALHLSRLAGLGCILCRYLGTPGTPAQIHHLREDQGAAQRGSDWTAVPLCEPHHTGPAGLHGLGRRGFEARYRLSELDLLALTIEALERDALR